MSVPHAEALADAMGDIVLQSITTKTDLREVDIGLRAEMKELSTTLRSEMSELSASLRSEVNELGSNLRSEMKELELRLMTRMGAMLAASTALTVAILGTLITHS